jgi:DNA-binding NarL/FixJ family response regulator
MVRDGLALVLNDAPDFEVVAEESDGARAVEAALSVECELAILDISMPRLTGLQAAKRISDARPDLRILMVSMHENEQYLFEAMNAGASGYVPKSLPHRVLLDACRAAMRGESFVYPGALTALLRDYLEGARFGEAVPEDVLTERELEVIKLIAEGHTGEEIAELLTISLKTVNRHRANLLEKLGMRNRVDLTRYAIRRGLVEA